MAFGHALRSLMLFLVFYTIFKPYEFQNARIFKISATSDNLVCFYIGNFSNGITFKTLSSPIRTPRVNKIKLAHITTSKQLGLFLNLAKPALMAKFCTSLYILSCGDIISNPGPFSGIQGKPKCNVCERTIACNHRTVQCLSCGFDFHYKCAGLSVKKYRIICLTNSPWMCVKCLFDVLPNSLDDTFSSQASSFSITNDTSVIADYGPTCLLANVRSIRNKLQAFHAMAYSARTDIIALTETWLDSSVLNHEILPSGYSIFRRDRSHRTGGGVLLACRDDLTCIRRNDLEVNDCELIWCEMSSTHGSRFLFGVFYRPPDTKTDYLELVAESFNLISRLNIDKIFLVGDFNLPHFDWVNQLPLFHDQLHIKTFELLNDLFLTQMNHHATRNNHILDLVFTSNPDLIYNVSVCESLVNSDHLNVNFNINLKEKSVVPRPKYVFDYKKANFKELKNTLQNTPWDVAFLGNDINVTLSNWEDLFWSVVKEFVPKKKIKDKLIPPWIDKEVKILCRKKDRASKKALRTKSPEDIETFKALRRDCKKLIRSKYNVYLHDLSRDVSNHPKKFWNFFSSKTKTRKIPSAIVKDESNSHPIIDPWGFQNPFYTPES